MNKPQTRWVFSLTGIVMLAAIAYVAMRPTGPGFIDPSDKTMVRAGGAVYRNYCASCHGEALQGQPDWRKRLANGRLPAPAHDETGHTWHHADELLIDMVKNGLVPGRTAPEGYVSDMPAYGEILSDEEIVAVLAYIKSTWPADILNMQKEVTRQGRK